MAISNVGLTPEQFANIQKIQKSNQSFFANKNKPAPQSAPQAQPKPAPTGGISNVGLTPEQFANVQASQKSLGTLQDLSAKGFGNVDVSRLPSNTNIQDIPKLSGTQPQPQPQPQPTTGGIDTSARDELRNRLLELQKPSEQELALQEKINNLLSSQEMGLNKISDETIPMPLQIGQSRSLMNQAATKISPLQRSLALAEARRRGNLQATQTGLGFAQEDLTQQREQQRIQEERKRQEQIRLQQQNEPFKVGNQLVQRQPDGSFKTVFGVPNDEGGFTLSEGQARFDAEGNIIASRGKTSASGGTSGGTGGGLVDDSGKPVKLTASQVDAFTGFETTISASKQALGLLSEEDVETGPIAGRLLQAAKFTGIGVNEKQLQLEQLLGKIKADFMKAISGAAVSEPEVKRLQKFLPDITDQESVIKSKLNTLQQEAARARKALSETLGVSGESSPDLKTLAQEKGFDLEAAKKAGYTDDEIRQTLTSQ